MKPRRLAAGCVAALTMPFVAAMISAVLVSGFSRAALAADRITVDTTPIARFDKNSSRTRFGALDYLGGFVFSSADRRLKGVSAISLRDGGNRFLALTDNGVWFAGHLTRDGYGHMG